MVKTVLDLFCGAGGFSLGFKDKNHKLIGVDNWPIAGKTWQHNIDGEFILQDVRNFDYQTIGKIDILIGSPPCQPHSIANVDGSGDLSLIEMFLEIKDYLKPAYWVMEETPLVATILYEFGWVRPRFLSAIDFNLPHHGKRLFAGNYPEPRKRKWRGKWVPTPVGRPPNMVWASKSLATEQWLHYLRTTDHEGMRKLLPEFERTHQYKTKMCAHVMGFPDNYKFFGTKKDRYIQIGNAVCPPISRAINQAIENGRTILDYLGDL